MNSSYCFSDRTADKSKADKADCHMICIHGATSKKCEFCIRIRDEGCGVNFLVEIYPTASFRLRVECSHVNHIEIHIPSTLFTLTLKSVDMV